jgi:hypothetical protein
MVQGCSRIVRESRPARKNGRLLPKCSSLEYHEATMRLVLAIIAVFACAISVLAGRAVGLKPHLAQKVSDVQFYMLDAAEPEKRTLAKLEPQIGLYLGVYVNEIGLTYDDVNIVDRVQADFAVYFRYFKLIRPENATDARPVFPERFVKAVKRAKVAVHIALEPVMPLKEITAELLTPFAEAARDAGVPMFVRFASEFNDPQSAWGGNPKLFVEKFRLVHEVMARIAPNVAMVWMPMLGNLERMAPYYPGEKYVDWVGLSLYNVPFVNGDRNQPGERLQPLEQLRAFYDAYSPRHPMQISEYATSHRWGAEPTRDFSRFAALKMRQLFWGAYLKMPRLKNINWLDLDMIDGKFSNPRPPERSNDYRLFANDAKNSAYLELFQEPYFLKAVEPFDPLRRPVPLPEKFKLGEKLRVAAWVAGNPINISRADWYLDGKLVDAAPNVPFIVVLHDTKIDIKSDDPTAFQPPELPLGKHVLEFRAFDLKGKLLFSKKQAMVVQ